MPYATDYTTLLSGSYWSGAEITGQPVILTYSFLATKPTSDPHGLGAALNTFTPFSAAQQTLTQQALARWSGVSGVIFEQVAPGKGDINFAAYNLGASGQSAGYFPWGNWDFSTATYTGPQNTLTAIRFAADTQAAGCGDVLMNTAGEDINGQFSYATLLHEIGHALGLKHPTDPWTTLVAHNQWDDNITPYDGNFSIMTPSGITSGLTDITGDDILAIDSIYGTAAQQWAQFASHSWNGTTYTLTGTLKDGGQTVRGVSTSNTITGGTGDDTIYAIGQGVNYIYGKVGDDTLVGGSGINYLDGGAGADTLNGRFSVNTYASYADAPSTGGIGVTVNLLNTGLNTGDAAGDVYLNIHKVQGSNYDDTIVADNSGDVIYGGAGNDSLTGGTGTDHLYGQAGADTLTAGAGTSYLDGGAGADTLIGSVGHASYAAFTDATAGVGVDLFNGVGTAGDALGDTYSNIHDVMGSNYADAIAGDNSGDMLYGGAGNDTITGGTGVDHLYGQAGADTLTAGAGTSYLDGGAGADTLVGSVGHASYAAFTDATAGVGVDLLNGVGTAGDALGDTYSNIHDVMGSNYADAITGDNSGDVIYGGAGIDTIIGGSGRDVLIGGAGADTLTGGLGADQFRYNAPSEGGDTITDFTAKQGDKIVVSAKGFGGALVAGPLNPAQFTSGTVSGSVGEFVWSAAGQTLSWDPDGAGPTGATLIATLQGVATLTAANIQIV